MSTVPRTRTRAPMDPLRKNALFAGGFYILTFAASIPAVFLLSPVLNNPNYVIGAGADTRVLIGACSTSSTPSRAWARRSCCSRW